MACEQCALAEVAHKGAEAKAYLKADGPVEERKRRAALATDVMVAYSDLCEAKMARRITEKAMHVREEELGVLTALCHAHNREVKVLEG